MKHLVLVCAFIIAINIISSCATKSDTPVNTLQQYSNPTLDFKISYPNDWILDRGGESSGIVWFLTQEREQQLEQEKPVRAFDIEVRVYNSVTDLPGNKEDPVEFDAWIETRAIQYGLIHMTPTKLSGEPAFSSPKDGLNGDVYYKVMAFHRGRVYEVTTGDTFPPNVIQQQMIESFRFLDNQ